MEQILNRTVLYESHLANDAVIVPFAGWEMPLRFGSILAEARSVRASIGMFDVSHMARIWIRGNESADFLNWLTTADVHKTGLNRARYTLLCDRFGGIIDDCIFYKLSDDEYLLIVNASNRDVVWNWLMQWKSKNFQSISLEDRTMEISMVALQGPRASSLLDQIAPGLSESIGRFRCVEADVGGIKSLVGRTGYTGEDGFEIMPASENVLQLWSLFKNLGVTQCGLASRDILRLEAGLLLHGTDMDVDRNPIEAGLERFVDMDSESVCTEALQVIERQGTKDRLVGFQMTERGVPRHAYSILSGNQVIGFVTSGGYSPTLDRNIGLGYVSSNMASPGSELSIDIRGKLVQAEVVETPFYSYRRV
jgi:aminomethyltransferase